MARPPKLRGNIPKVRADWEWTGPWGVTGDALLRGAWQLSGQRRVALFFVNVGSEELAVELDFDGRRYGLEQRSLCVKTHTPEGGSESFNRPLSFVDALSLPPRSARVWEIRENDMIQSE